jgi:pyruvate/2-oxoglutarate/acetoin dehydrogenase E1 component
MTYKENLIAKKADLALDPKVIFLGYNVKYGHQFNGTLVWVPQKQRIELPVAENLIMGVAMGMALEGYQPIVCIERIDFLWACADAIINHLDKAKQLGWGNLPVIIRTCICGNTPLDAGCQHLGDYTEVWRRLLNNIRIERYWNLVCSMDGPVMIIEDRRDYETNRTA